MLILSYWELDKIAAILHVTLQVHYRDKIYPYLGSV